MRDVQHRRDLGPRRSRFHSFRTEDLLVREMRAHETTAPITFLCSMRAPPDHSDVETRTLGLAVDERVFRVRTPRRQDPPHRPRTSSTHCGTLTAGSLQPGTSARNGQTVGGQSGTPARVATSAMTRSLKAAGNPAVCVREHTDTRIQCRKTHDPAFLARARRAAQSTQACSAITLSSDDSRPVAEGKKTDSARGNQAAPKEGRRRHEAPAGGQFAARLPNGFDVAIERHLGMQFYRVGASTVANTFLFSIKYKMTFQERP